MKKRVMLLLFTSLLLSFISCSSGDESNGVESNGEDSELIALLKTQKWVGEDIYFNDDDWYYSETRITLYFMDDNIGYYYEFSKDQYEPGENEYSTYFTEFTYKVSENVVSTCSKDGISHNYTYNAGVLESGGWYYIPESITQGDYDLIEEQIEKYTPEGGSCGVSLKYSYDKVEKILRIYGNGDMYDYSTSNQPWHDYDIQELIIEEGVTSIGDYFLYDLCSLDELKLPKSLKRIGVGAFCGVYVEEVNIPASVTEIGEYAFYDNGILRFVDFARNNNLRTIGNFAFGYYGYRDTPAIYTGDSKGLVVGSNMRSIGSNAFERCDVGNITFDEGIKNISAGAFMGAEISNTVIKFPNSLETIGSVAFVCSFSTIRLGSGIKEIGNEAFITNNSGKLYINSRTPPKVDSDFIISYDYGFYWALYVPKGCKSAYSKYPWSQLFTIYEDSSLSGNN